MLRNWRVVGLRAHRTAVDDDLFVSKSLESDDRYTFKRTLHVCHPFLAQRCSRIERLMRFLKSSPKLCIAPVSYSFISTGHLSYPLNSCHDDEDIHRACGAYRCQKNQAMTTTFIRNYGRSETRLLTMSSMSVMIAMVVAVVVTMTLLCH